MKYDKLIDLLNQIAPLDLQEEWDNSGVQIAVNSEYIDKVMIALEITDEIIDEAKTKQADMIITHHPLFFSGQMSIDCRTTIGRHINKLIKAGINVYSLHTPFDKADGGNNDYLTELLGLVDTGAFVRNGELELIGRVGRFTEAVTLRRAVDITEEKLLLPNGVINAVGNMDAYVETVGICVGAGADLLETAAENGCELFITGDLKYHDARKAEERGLCVIDAGHYGTERFFTDNFYDKLTEIINKTEEGFGREGHPEIIKSEININPFEIL